MVCTRSLTHFGNWPVEERLDFHGEKGKVMQKIMGQCEVD